MGSLGEELALRIGAVQRSLEEEGAAPLDGTAATIKRKRTARHAATAGIAAVAALAVAGIGTAAVRRSLDAQPAASWLPPGGDVVAIPADGPNPTRVDIGVECGDPAPNPKLEDDGFALEVTMDDADEWTGLNVSHGRVTVRNDNEEEFPGFILQPDIVYVRDGVVVGVAPGAGLMDRGAFGPNRTALTTDFYMSDWAECGGEQVALEPGEYQAYIVTTTANSPEIAALSTVSGPWGMLPAFNQDRWLHPSDWECTHSVGWGIGEGSGSEAGSSFAAACLPSQDPAVAWDPETRSLVLPYTDGSVTRVYATTLISEPVTVTFTDGDDGYWGPEPWDRLPTDADAVCGADLGYPGEDTVANVDVLSETLTYPTLRSIPTIDGFVWSDWGPGWPYRLDGRAAQVSFAPRARAYLTYQGSEYVEEYDTWRATATVAGTAWVTVNGGQDLWLHRTDGPTTMPITFEDIEWCPDLPDLGEITAVVVGDVTVRTDAADVTRPVFYIWAGYYR